MILFIIAISAYFLGGIPTGYLLVKYTKNVSPLKSGYKNTGASNVSKISGQLPGLFVGTFDCLIKGTLPIIICKILEQPTYLQAIVGILCVIGHNWSPYLKTSGGRGVATSIGILIAFQMWGSLIISTILIAVVGRLFFKDTAFWVLLSFITLPFTAHQFDNKTSLTLTWTILLLVIILKRITANWENPRIHNKIQVTLINRLLFDRDMKSKRNWNHKLNL